MSSELIASGLIDIIKAPITLVVHFWQFLFTPMFTLDLSFLNNLPDWVLALFSPILTNLEFGTYDISILFFFSSIGILLFIGLKIFTLVNPLG